MTVSEYNLDFLPSISRAVEFIALFESAIRHMDEKTVNKDEVLKQFQIRCWSEETKQTILTALNYYKKHEGLDKVECMEAKPYNKKLIPKATRGVKDMGIDWVSVIKNGNPKEDGEYLVTYIDYGSGNPRVTVKRWQTDKWWFDGKYAIVLAYADLPKPYEEYRRDMESL